MMNSSFPQRSNTARGNLLPPGNHAAPRSDNAILALLISYCLGVLYASLMPYDLTATPEQVQIHLHDAFDYWPLNRDAHICLSDLISNILLYMPLGLLAALTWRRRSPVRACLLALLLGTTLSVIVETSQLFSLTRTSSILDVEANALGTFIGAGAGSVVGWRLWCRLETAVCAAWFDAPCALVSVLLLLFLTADALYPWYPTLDVSEVWGHIKQSRWTLEAGLDVHPWHYWIVKRVGPWAALTLLLAGWRPPLVGALLAAMAAAALEAAKIFIYDGSWSTANVVLSAGGALVGLVLATAFRQRTTTRLKLALAWVLLVGYILYMEWSGGPWQWDWLVAADKMPRGAEWLPGYHFAMSGRVFDVQNFVTRVSLLAALAFVGRTLYDLVGYRGAWSTPARALLWAGVFGVVCQLGKFLVPGRVPSTTDVGCFAVGAALGSWIAGLRQQQAPKGIPGSKIPNRKSAPHHH